MAADFTFVHCADLHLGSRFTGLMQKDPTAGQRFFDAPFKAFSRMVDIAIEKADFMVISGDMYDDSWQTTNTRYRFVQELKRFGKPVYMVRGNHDFGDRWEKSLPYPDNVKVFDSKPERVMFTIRGRQVEIVGVSFSTAHTHDNLAQTISGSEGCFTIGVVHCSLDETGEGSEYAPCSRNDLIGKDVQYWALGHIHKKTVIDAHGTFIVYPGNIQGRNPKESGPKGGFLVSVSGDRVDAEFQQCQDIEWCDLVVDITGMTNINQIQQEVRASSRPGSVVDLKLTGIGPLDVYIREDSKGLADLISDECDCSVAIGSYDTRPLIDIDAEASRDTVIADIIRTGREISSLSDAEILELIQDGPPTQNIKEYLKYYAEKGLLGRMAEDATISLVYKVKGADE